MKRIRISNKDIVEYFKNRLREQRKKEDKKSKFKFFQKRKMNKVALAKLAFSNMRKKHPKFAKSYKNISAAAKGLIL